MTKAHETRIPNKFVDMVGEGEITLSMLFVMTFLYRWVTWSNGVVPKVSASGLATWSQGAYSPTTFKEALQKLDLCGHITGHMTQPQELSRDHKQLQGLQKNAERR